jgi:hypothetical protein
MQMTSEQQAIIRRWVNDNPKVRVCLQCPNPFKDMLVSRNLYRMHRIEDVAEIVPLVVVRCSLCGQTKLFDARVIGVLPDETQDAGSGLEGGLSPWLTLDAEP